ncbi:hypothetical protein SAMN05192563_1004339 [Paraburkholderia aspalathi]|uniref:Uncharacterized protein n=1 Tax=Paraburkholderia aspalathi TaxID=1324617 RepID=A0A1I7BBU4_9BURK|nr:hypothetical protein SAMN05192563_1004339 [Paraburkholderia aspalathi]
MMARAAASTSEAERMDAAVTLKMQTDLAHGQESLYEYNRSRSMCAKHYCLAYTRCTGSGLEQFAGLRGHCGERILGFLAARNDLSHFLRHHLDDFHVVDSRK